MQPVISAEQMRNIDRLTAEELDLPSFQLMENAAHACFLEVQKLFSGNLSDKRILVLCGPGNNGGDGAALAQQLVEAGAQTIVVLFGSVDGSKGDARTNFERVRDLAKSASLKFGECSEIGDWEHLDLGSDFDLIVDALFGTGLTRPLIGIFAAAVEFLNKLRSSDRATVFSVDLPSGLNADSPTLIGPTVRADITVTFTAPKIANVLAPAAHHNGRLKVAQIGSPRQLLDDSNPSQFLVDENDVKRWLRKTRYTAESFKNSHGHVLVIAGSKSYSGAAVLCGNSAMSSGAGLVTVATPVSAQASVAAKLMPEVIVTSVAETDRGAISDDAIDHVNRLASKATVIALGPGLTSDDERTRRLVYWVVKQRRTPVVIDADGLNCLSPWPEDLQGSPAAPLILTPHAGEMLRLLGTDDKTTLDDRADAARTFATRHNLILVLKGSPTLVAAGGQVFINPTGNPGVGTAGSGDTLTGIIASFIAQDVASAGECGEVLNATIAALYVAGLAADQAAARLGMRAMVASDIRNRFGEAICALDSDGEQP